jgi:hypothetical protein
MEYPAPFPESQVREAVAQAICWSDALRALGYEPKGHNIRTLQRWVAKWRIPTDHFDPYAAQHRAADTRRRPLDEVMVENSTYTRGQLKPRLVAAGLKRPICEMCGQDEVWQGNRMSMVLDHINGVANDHRLDNLRMVCPNCAATLDTHCGRNAPRERACPGCGRTFVPRNIRNRYCSRECAGVDAHERYSGVPKPEARKVERPPYEQLREDVAAMSMVAVGRKYGVSDNAIRKWLRWYENERQRGLSDGSHSTTA